MVAMTFSPVELRHEDAVLRPGPYTVADVRDMPADGYRHELLDGTLVMSPAPSFRHQDIALSLAILLKGRVPQDMKVWISPFDVIRLPDMLIEPDVVVTRRADLTTQRAEVRQPLLCVEVASPSTRSLDHGRKKDFLAEIGCPSYWTIEPDRGPELTVWTLVDGAYTKEVVVTGSESWTAELPFEVTVVPAALLDD